MERQQRRARSTGRALRERRRRVAPCGSASATWCTTRSASRLRSRSMNSVPAAGDQPRRAAASAGRRPSRRSAPAARRHAIAMMSSHDTWLATQQAGAGCGAPAHSSPMPSTAQHAPRPPADALHGAAASSSERKHEQRTIRPAVQRVHDRTREAPAPSSATAGRRRAPSVATPLPPLVGEPRAGDERAAHAPRQLVAEANGVCLPWLRSAGGVDRPALVRVEDAEVGRTADRRRSRPGARRQPSRTARRRARAPAPAGHRRERLRQRQPVGARPIAARGRAAVRGRSRPARPRRKAGSWRPRRPACGR